jgi:hypothetical protein
MNNNVIPATVNTYTKISHVFAKSLSKYKKKTNYTMNSSVKTTRIKPTTVKNNSQNVSEISKKSSQVYETDNTDKRSSKPTLFNTPSIGKLDLSRNSSKRLEMSPQITPVVRIWMCVSKCVYMFTCIRLCLHICMYIDLSRNSSKRIEMSPQITPLVCVCVCVNEYVYLFLYMYIYVSKYLCICVYTYMYMSIYVYVYTCIDMYIY